MSTNAFAIDFGTTYSRLSIVHEGKIKILTNDQDDTRIPNYVAFTENGTLVGQSAKNQADFDPQNTVFHIKRLIGQRLHRSRVQSDMKSSPFHINSENKKFRMSVKCMGEKKNISPVAISSIILTEMRDIAQAHLGKQFKSAVISVPVTFNSAQRKAIKEAGHSAGLKIVRIIDETMATATIYGSDMGANKEGNILILDLGGGSLSLSIVSFDRGYLQVKATGGDSHLGGLDFENRMVEHFVQGFETKHNIDIDENAIFRLRMACERAKRKLSTSTTAKIDIDPLYDGYNFHSKITRTKFQELCDDLFDSIVHKISKLIADAKITKSAIKNIVLVGGSTKIPKIHWLLRDFFRQRQLNICSLPDEAVAYGSALIAAKLSGDKSAVANNLILRESTPLSLGVESKSGLMSVLIKRNTLFPVRCSTFRSTSRDNQTTVEFPIYEGERVLLKDNRILCKVILSGITPAPRGIPQIEIIIDIDAHGILYASAINHTSGKKQQRVYVTNYMGRFSAEEIKRQVEEGIRYKMHDRFNRTRVMARRRLEAYCIQKRKACAGVRFKNRYSAKHLKELTERVQRTLRWLDGDPMVGADIYDRKQLKLVKLFSRGLKTEVKVKV